MNNQSARSLKTRDLLSNISHAAHSPIGSILNLTELILLGVEGEINGEVRRDVQEIVADAENLRGILSSVLELCRVDSAETLGQVQAIDVSPPVWAALQRVAGGDTITGKKVTVYIPDGLPTVEANNEGLCDLVERLVRHMASAVDEEIIFVSASLEAKHITLSIGKGQGLTQPSPSDPVELPDRWLKDALALDLLICKRLAERQGGELWASHVPGHEIVLNVSLPIR